MSEHLPNLKTLAEACIAAGEYLPGDAWTEDRSYSPAEVAWLEFAAQATPAAFLALLKDLESHKRMLLAAACDIGAIGQALGADENDDSSEIEGLAAELRKDAERYRWLRDPDGQEDLGSDYVMPPIICGYAEHEDILATDALDRAIDTGIEEMKS